MEARRVILIGKTGNGKSSTGNSILGEDVFKSKKSSNAVTSQCAVHTRKRRDGRVFTVCDTPGLFCHGEDPIEMSLKLQQSVELCPKPHAFLLVFSGASRMTTDEKYTITLLRVIFGDKMFNHCIVVITRVNEFESQSEFKNIWTENNEMKDIVERCGNRVVKIENAKQNLEKSELGGLLVMIEQMASKGSYDQGFLKTHKEVLQEYKLTYGVSNSEDIDKHLNKILNTLEKRLEEEERRLKEEKRKAVEEKKRLEEEKRKAVEEKKRLEEEKRKAEEEKRKAEEVKRKVEEERKRLEEEMRQAQKLEEERRKMIEEEDRRRKEDERKRKEEEIRRIEEARRLKQITQKLEEERRKMREEEDKRRKEDERRRKEEEIRKINEEKRLKERKRQRLIKEERRREEMESIEEERQRLAVIAREEMERRKKAEGGIAKTLGEVVLTVGTLGLYQVFKD